MLPIVLKFLHIAGVVVFIGNMVITAVWKALADSTGDSAIAAYAQRLVLLTDKYLLIPSIAVLTTTGYVHAHRLGIPIWTDPSFLTAQVLFFASGIIWALVLRPVQHRQMNMANEFAKGARLTGEYMALTRRWLVWGVIATVLPVGSMFFMIHH